MTKFPNGCVKAWMKSTRTETVQSRLKNSKNECSGSVAVAAAGAAAVGVAAETQAKENGPTWNNVLLKLPRAQRSRLRFRSVDTDASDVGVRSVPA